METEGRRQKLQQQERGSGAAGSSSRWGVGLSSGGPPAQPAPQYAHRLTSPTMTLQTPERALSGEPRAAGPRGPGPCPRGQVVSLPGLLGRMGGRPHESHGGTALTPGSGQGGSRGFGRFQALPLGPFLVERAAVPWGLATVTPTRAHLTPHGPHAKIEAQSAVPVQPGPSGEHIRPLAEGCLGPHFPVAPEQGFPQQGQAPHCICVGGIRHWPKASAPGVWATQGPSLRGWPLPSWGQQWGDTEDGGPSLHCRGAQWGGVEGLPLPQPLDPSRARPSHLAFCGPWASVRHARQLDSHLLACCPFPRVQSPLARGSLAIPCWPSSQGLHLPIWRWGPLLTTQEWLEALQGCLAHSRPPDGGDKGASALQGQPTWIPRTGMGEAQPCTENCRGHMAREGPGDDPRSGYMDRPSRKASTGGGGRAPDMAAGDGP